LKSWIEERLAFELRMTGLASRFQGLPWHRECEME